MNYNKILVFSLTSKTTLLSKKCWHISQNQTVMDVGKAPVSTPIVVLLNATRKRALIFVFNAMDSPVRKRISILI